MARPPRIESGGVRATQITRASARANDALVQHNLGGPQSQAM